MLHYKGIIMQRCEEIRVSKMIVRLFQWYITFSTVNTGGL